MRWPWQRRPKSKYVVPRVVIYTDPNRRGEPMPVQIPNDITIDGIRYLVADEPVEISASRDGAVTVRFSIFSRDVRFKERKR